MSLEIFDTLAFSKRLQAAGVPAIQAEAQAEAQADLLVNHLFARLATKKDLERFATKDDLSQFATRKDLERYATKTDLELAAKGIIIKLGGILGLSVMVLAAMMQVTLYWYTS